MVEVKLSSPVFGSMVNRALSAPPVIENVVPVGGAVV